MLTFKPKFFLTWSCRTYVFQTPIFIITYFANLQTFIIARLSAGEKHFKLDFKYSSTLKLLLFKSFEDPETNTHIPSKIRGKKLQELKQLPEQHHKCLCRPTPILSAQTFQTRSLSLPAHQGDSQLPMARSSTTVSSCGTLRCLIFCSRSELHTSLPIPAQRWWSVRNMGAPATTALPPNCFLHINCTKRSRQVKEAKQYFIDS